MNSAATTPPAKPIRPRDRITDRRPQFLRKFDALRRNRSTNMVEPLTNALFAER